MQKPLRCSCELSRLDQNGMYIATSVLKKDRQLGSKELKVHFFVEVRFLAPSGKKGRKRKRPFCVCSSSPSYSYSSLSSLVGRTLAEPPPPPLMETCGSPLCPPNPSFLPSPMAGRRFICECGGGSPACSLGERSRVSGGVCFPFR